MNAAYWYPLSVIVYEIVVWHLVEALWLSKRVRRAYCALFVR